MSNKTIKIEFPTIPNMIETKQYIEDNFIIDQITGRMVRKGQNYDIIIIDYIDKIK